MECPTQLHVTLNHILSLCRQIIITDHVFSIGQDCIHITPLEHIQQVQYCLQCYDYLCRQGMSQISIRHQAIKFSPTLWVFTALYSLLMFALFYSLSCPYTLLQILLACLLRVDSFDKCNRWHMQLVLEHTISCLDAFNGYL